MSTYRYTRKSQDGLWVDGIYDHTTGEMIWRYQTRIVRDAGFMVEVGANGEELSRTPAPLAKTRDPWVEIGRIDSSDPVWWEIAGHRSMLMPVVHGTVEQVVDLIVGGWGDTPGDVVQWLSEPLNGDWLVEPPRGYLLHRCVGEMEGFIPGMIWFISPDNDQIQFRSPDGDLFHLDKILAMKTVLISFRVNF